MAIRYFIIGVLLLLVIACDDPLRSNQGTLPDRLINSSRSLFSGSVRDTGDKKIKGIDTWRVSIENENGSVVSFYWRKNFGNLMQIVGEKGPFDYDLKPPFDVINFSSARFLAINNHPITAISSWTFEAPINDPLQWMYTFSGPGASEPIKIDATSGFTIR